MAVDKTWLFIPAKERFLKNIEKQSADYIILDLEDSLAEHQKDEGLRLTTEILQKYGKQKNIFVRINSGERQQQEVTELCKQEFAGIMFPKFEDVFVGENAKVSYAIVDSDAVIEAGATVGEVRGSRTKIVVIPKNEIVSANSKKEEA